MTSGPTYDGGNDMDLNETMLKQRLDAAVGDLNPDAITLAGAALATGRQLRRRRRLQGTLGAAAAVALLTGGITFAGTSTDLFGAHGTGPADHDDNGELVQLVPATPRGMAAALMTHTAGLGSLIGVGGSTDPAAAGGVEGVMAEVGYTLPDGSKVDISLYASPDLSQWQPDKPCTGMSDGQTCQPRTLPDGTSGAYLTLEPAKDLGVDSADGPATTTGFIVARDDQVLIVVQSTIGSATTPLDEAALEAIVMDPAVGLSTTAALNDTGNEIADFQSDGMTVEGGSAGSSSGSGSAGPVPTTSTTGAPRVHVRPIDGQPDSSSASGNSSSGSSVAPPR